MLLQQFNDIELVNNGGGVVQVGVLCTLSEVLTNVFKI